MKNIGPRWPITRGRARPRGTVTYGCILATNNGQPIDDELDEALRCAAGVTWTMVKQGSTWRGAIFGSDPDQVELVRQYLVDQKGWRPRDLSDL